MDYAVYVHDVGHVVIDNLQFMLSGQGRQAEVWDLQNAAISAFRRFATQRNTHLSIVVHPRKEVPQRQTPERNATARDKQRQMETDTERQTETHRHRETDGDRQTQRNGDGTSQWQRRREL